MAASSRKPIPATTSPAPRNRTLRESQQLQTGVVGPADKTPRSIRYTASFKAAKAGKYLLLAAASRQRSLSTSASTANRSRAGAGRRPGARIRHPRSHAPARPSTWWPTICRGFAGQPLRPRRRERSRSDLGRSESSSPPSPTWSSSPSASTLSPKARATIAPSLCPGARTR